ncbi:hypothetical protein [Neobacillus terrae]|uniref:hypothetical protein n=1 Tax=Neobacillus terrae TaxID=3034837 RepID=UPI001FB0BA94|nr:hypothetical protein [Neobacillus terrae]
MKLNGGLYKFFNGHLENKKVTIITTASLEKQHNKYAVKANEDLKNMGFRHGDFTDIEFDQPIFF